MKFTQEHLSILKTGIDKAIESNGGEEALVSIYKEGAFPRADKTKDLQRRFCWDLFWASGVKIGDGIGTHGDIIGDYTDEHIYTALRSICPKIWGAYET